MEVAQTIRPELGDKGGHFYRSDFQVHTPRDTQWTGVRPVSDADRKAWAQEFVAQCRAKALHAVAITDHHDLTFFPYISEASADETDANGNPVAPEDRLIVFPGLELTLSVPCQAILILDADFPHGRLSDVLIALNFDPIDPSLPVIPQTTVLGDSGNIALLHEKLDKHPWLKGRYILLPNVTPSGHKTLMRTSFQEKYNDMPCVGGYFDGDIAVLSKPKYIGERLILAGKDKAWGNKKLAIFQTSDSRADGFDDLGRYSTWIKWSRPTAEAIRQACLAEESRIAQVEPSSPSVWLTRVVVSNSKFMGRIDVALNPQYTALIGGRGTGKSTILDYMRWALCDQPASASEDDEVADPRVRQRRLIDATLVPVDAHVEVHCAINGISHVVRRHAKTGEVQLKVGGDPFTVVRESTVQSLLPIQAYSQKQLSSVAIRVEELLRFVTSPIQRQLEGIDRTVAELAGRLRENYGTLQRFRVLETDIATSRLRIASLASQAQSLRDGLAGLSEEDRSTLDQKAGHDDAKNASSEWSQQVASAMDSIADVKIKLDIALARLTSQGDLPVSIGLVASQLLSESKQAIANSAELVSAAFTDLDMATSPQGSVGAKKAELERHLAAFEQTYTSVKERSSAHEVKLEELAALEHSQLEARGLLSNGMGTLGPNWRGVTLSAQLRSRFNVTRCHRRPMV
jgi:chromosome segregation protein